MEIQITKNTSMDGFTITVFILLSLAVVGVFFLVSYANGQEELGLADIDKMGCGELKDFILNKGWKEYGARTTMIKLNAEHQYTWMCEK